MRTLFSLLMIVGLAGGGGYYYYNNYAAAEAANSFRTAQVKRGTLLSTISATGTVEPEELVDVGAQVAGKISFLGRDPQDPSKPIDYRSVVKEGTLLAQIDDAIYKAQVDQSQALLQRAQADLLQFQAKLLQAEQEWKRAETLRPTRAIADSDYDMAVANYHAAKANLAVGDAAIKQAEASLRLTKTNLDYTVIKSPVNGVIIDRRVNVGQTVVASLNAPSMFLIAKDLRRIQVWASVNEADIGRIREGMPVQFTVDAHPGEVFRGKVIQVRLNATTNQNVVTYTVVVVTDNPDGKLLPYLTANLRFELEEHPNVLMVPNAALRWRPRPTQVAPELRDTLFPAGSSGQGGGSSMAGSGRSGKSSGEAGAPAGEGRARKSSPREDRNRLWVEDGNYVRPIDVQVGPSDGLMTEVSGGELKDGMEVVIGEARRETRSDNGDTTNPFAPKLFRGGKG